MLPPLIIASTGDLLEGLFWLVMVVVYFVIQIARATAKGKAGQTTKISGTSSKPINGMQRELEAFLNTLTEQSSARTPTPPPPPKIHITSVRPAATQQEPPHHCEVDPQQKSSSKKIRHRDPNPVRHSDPEPKKAPVIAPTMESFRKAIHVRSSMRNMSSLRGLNLSSRQIRGISESGTAGRPSINLQNRNQLRKALLASFVLEKPKALQKSE